MILIDKPYVSDFLKETLEKTQIQVIKTPFAEKELSGFSIRFVTEQEAVNLFDGSAKVPLYTNSENAIEWVENHLPRSAFAANNKLFKNKILFRELIKPMYPDFFFLGIPFDELDELDISNFSYPFVIKPAVGFFSLGVHIVENAAAWKNTLVKIKREIEIQKGVYPEIVLNTSQFIVEQNIEGDEYALDCYFDSAGKVTILNIMHHLFSSGKDTNDRVYSTSKQIVENNIQKMETFLQSIGNLANLKNYPAHVEVRVDAQGKVVPIEVNPMRFGGWCTTADLTWFAYQFNSYEYYQKGLKPDWNKVFEGKENSEYSLIVLDNSTGKEPSEIKEFNYDKLIQNFNNLLHLRKVNHQKYLIFGFAFIETSIEDKSELNFILHSNLTEFIS